MTTPNTWYEYKVIFWQDITEEAVNALGTEGWKIIAISEGFMLPNGVWWPASILLELEHTAQA
jgi:hypothetical protein